MHNKCHAHILDIIVDEVVMECDNAITMVHNAVRYVHSSLTRLHKFKRCSGKEKTEYKKMLLVDMPTRWNAHT